MPASRDRDPAPADPAPAGPAAVNRILLVRHGPTAATLARVFPTDEPLTPSGREAAATLAATFPPADGVLSSPAARCQQTAAAAELIPRLDPRLAECDFGSWAGRTLAEVNADDPDGVRSWMTDRSARPHGGETLNEFADRVKMWLAEHRAGTTIAITHGGVIRAAVAHATAAPPNTIWRTEVAPLSVTELAPIAAAWQIIRVNEVGLAGGHA